VIRPDVGLNVVVVEMSKASRLVSGVVPGVERQPLKKLEPDALLRLIERWRNEAVRAGRPIRRIVLAYEAGTLHTLRSMPTSFHCAGMTRRSAAIPARRHARSLALRRQRQITNLSV
jgi:hypothetical protein